MGFISKEKIQDYLNAINPCEACSAYGEGAIDVIQHCLIYLDEMPEVDAVPVVRCGECKYMLPCGRCTMFADDKIRPSVSDFCSHGERGEAK